MRVAFIIPDKEMMWDSVHQGVGYIAAYAQKFFSIDDLQIFRTYDKAEQELDSFLNLPWDVLGITLTNPAIVEASAICQKIKKKSNAKVVVGGSEVTAIEDKIFQTIPLIDFAIAGEGEITFVELLKCIQNMEGFADIDGLIYRDAQGNICKNKRRDFVNDLGIFPWPDRSLFKYDYQFHSIIGTRGCPYHCTFCNSSANWRHQYRVRPPQDVFEEIKQTIDRYGRDLYFSFNDDAFNINKQWVIEVCRLIERLQVRIFIRGIRAGLVTKEVAEALKAAGCFGVACGVESADNDALRIMRKATNVEEIERGVQIMKKSGIPNIIGQFIIGNQGDTLETVKKSIEMAKIFTEIYFGVAYPIPNTALYDYIEMNGYFLPEKVPVKHNGKIIDWILFDTPHFPVEERLKAVDLAIEAKMYHNIDYSHETA